MADKALKILDAKYIISPISCDRLQRIETPEYPHQAIREILFNAIVHREYKEAPITVRVYPDRVRIWNIGLLPAGMTVEKLKTEHESRPRNKLMAKAFYLGGHIESWAVVRLRYLKNLKNMGFLNL